WQSTTVAVKPGDVFNYSVGIGGARRNGVKTSGENGTASTITKGGSTVVASAGSIGPAGNTANNTRTGRGAAASSIAALALPGSADVNSPGNQDDTTIVDGNPPGGGGLGGPSVGWMNNGSTKYSGMGGRGEIRYRFRYRGTASAIRAFRGTVEVWRRDPVDTVLTSGTGSFTAPSYAAFMDVGVIGGGASGATGDNGVTTAAGSGAPAAVWQSTTVAVKPGDVFNYSVGIGGARRNGVKTSGENGTASTITKGGSTVVASAGSIGPAGNTAN
ncbi:glycine-rich domain-containing protein, partial [Tsukamurella pulmonis]|uniref:glycine-rich domain-containing protein n=1 Tax=Tsukamurella pulmonis TaxID=47312 RepID=UPI000A54E3D4